MNGCAFCSKYRYDHHTGEQGCTINNTQSLGKGCTRIEFLYQVYPEPWCAFCGLHLKCNAYDGVRGTCESRDRFGNRRFALDYKVYRDVRSYILADIEISEWEHRKSHLMEIATRFRPIMDRLFPDS